jgi:transcriptional regulator with XRE-family HTH domain
MRTAHDPSVEPREDRRERAGQAIREARLAKGWNQERLAEALSTAMQSEAVAGRAQTVGQSSVSRWESGEAAPEAWKLPAIEAALEIPAGRLAAVLYEQPVNPVRASQLEERMDRIELALREMVDLLRDLDRRIQGR